MGDSNHHAAEVKQNLGVGEVTIAPATSNGGASALIVRGTILSVGLAGIAFFLRSTRLFTKFNSVSQIPKEFIKREFELKGQVRDLLPSGTLKVEHIPFVRLPKIVTTRMDNKERLLNVRIAGLNMTNPGKQFLEKDLEIRGRKILFTVIKTSKDRDPVIDAEVTVQKNPFLHTNVNVELIRRGYAKVLSLDDPEHQKTLHDVPSYSRLVSKLLMCEKIADRRGVGMWQRESWVESIAAYPSQFSQIVKHSALTRFTVSGTFDTGVYDYEGFG
uniref:TNase-like domain-containing protein n=1 Tax=Syphacia muris TaxID=451379 RepID=A0A0N5AFZ9_9BILA